jgi:hypothetical protein
VAVIPFQRNEKAPAKTTIGTLVKIAENPSARQHKHWIRRRQHICTIIAINDTENVRLFI